MDDANRQLLYTYTFMDIILYSIWIVTNFVLLKKCITNLWNRRRRLQCKGNNSIKGTVCLLLLQCKGNNYIKGTVCLLHLQCKGNNYIKGTVCLLLLQCKGNNYIKGIVCLLLLIFRRVYIQIFFFFCPSLTTVFFYLYEREFRHRENNSL